MAIKINPRTKQAAAWRQKYACAKYRSVEELYKKPSAQKIRIEYLIQKYMKQVGAEDYRVLGGNTSHFTVGYMMPDDSLQIETWDNTYNIPRE